MGTLNNGASATLQISVTVNAAGPYANTAQVSASDQGDPDSTPNNNNVGEDDQSTSTPTPVDVADLALSKVVNNPNPTVGSNFTYTLTVSNIGPSNATNVTAIDQLPTGVTLVSAVSSQGAYDNTTGVWTIGTIAANANATLQITVTLNAAGAIANSAQVTASDQSDPDSIPNNGIGNGEDDQASVITPQGIADLSLTKTGNNTTPNVGSNVTFTITLNNVGPDDATNVTVQDALPAGYTFVLSTPSQGTYDAATGVWTVGTLTTTVNATLQIIATVNAVGPYNNTAQVGTVDQFDSDSSPNNNIAGEDDESVVIVTPIPAVSNPTPTAVPTRIPGPALIIVDPVISKSVNPPFAIPGDTVTWTITVTNPGTIAVTNIVIVDNLPSEVQVSSVSSTLGNISANGQTVTITLSVLQPGQSATATIVTRVRPNASVPFIITNTASISNAENLTPRLAEAVLLSVTQLPTTGETPGWRLPVITLLLITLTCIVSLTFRVLWMGVSRRR